jgi:hypothetical protein
LMYRLRQSVGRLIIDSSCGVIFDCVSADYPLQQGAGSPEH